MILEQVLANTNTTYAFVVTPAGEWLPLGDNEDAFDGIEYEYSQRAVFHALKNGILRIRFFRAGEINRSGQTILITGDINRITKNIIETAFKKFDVPNTTTLNIENTEGDEVFKGTYDKYKIFKRLVSQKGK